MGAGAPPRRRKIFSGVIYSDKLQVREEEVKFGRKFLLYGESWREGVGNCR